MKSSGILPSLKIAWNVISILTGTQIINAMWLKWNIGKPLFHPIKEILQMTVQKSDDYTPQ